MSFWLEEFEADQAAAEYEEGGDDLRPPRQAVRQLVWIVDERQSTRARGARCEQAVGVPCALGARSGPPELVAVHRRTGQRQYRSIAPAGRLVQPTVHEVDRHRESECEKGADPPRRRVPAAALVRVQEDEDRRRRIERPSNEKCLCCQRGGNEDRANLAARP
jgi:hypothetical protein